MALKLSDVISAVTESTYWARLTAAYDAVTVPWKSWPLRSPYLAVSKFVTKALGEASELVAGIAAGMFLDTAQGDPLTLFSKSQYGLDRTDPQFTTGRFLLTAVAGSPTYAFVPGQIRAGTPGPTSGSKIFDNTEAGTLYPGQTILLDFVAEQAGDSYNIPNATSLDLKTSFAGVTVSNPASGPALRIGVGNASLLFYAAAGPVTISIVSDGASQPLSFSVDFLSKAITIHLRTNGAAVAQSTAEEVRAFLKAHILGLAVSLATLLVELKLGGDGTGIVAVTASPVELPFYSTWIESPGSPVEQDDSLKTRDRTRWDTLGGGAGDGNPIAAVATADALEFYARAVPAGRAASPVSHVFVASNLDIDTGMVSGGVISLIIAGRAGALSAPDVAAVESNFYNPRKFAYAAVLKVRSAANLVISLVGTVNVLLSSGKTTSDVASEIAAALATYPTDIAMTVYPTNVSAHMQAADFAAIRDIVLTSPAAPVVAGYNQIPVFDTAGLVYVLV